MERSLSVLLPVHNSQSTLKAQVEEILEVLPELTPTFELVIIDDGSSDATIEVADELASRYPQVRAVRHGVRMGQPAAVQTGLQQSSGEIVCLHEGREGLPIDEVRRVWQSLDRPSPGPRLAGERRDGHAHVLRPTAAGFQLCRRESMMPGQEAERATSAGSPRRPKFATRLEKQSQPGEP